MTQIQPDLRPILKNFTTNMLSTKQIMHDGGPCDFQFAKEQVQFNRRIIKRIQSTNGGN